MAHMIVNTPAAKRTVYDYDILFNAGMMLPITIDSERGDTIDWDASTIQVHIESKPSQADPEVIIPGEDTTIYLTHVLSVQRRTREVRELSPDQKADLSRTWQMMATHPTVQ